MCMSNISIFYYQKYQCYVSYLTTFADAARYFFLNNEFFFTIHFEKNSIIISSLIV